MERDEVERLKMAMKVAALIATMLCVVHADAPWMNNSFMSGPNLGTASGIASFNSQTIASSPTTLFKLGSNGRFVVNNDIYNSPQAGSSLYSNGIRLWVFGSGYNPAAFSYDGTSFTSPSGLSSCDVRKLSFLTCYSFQEVVSIADSGAVVFMSCLKTSTMLYSYFASIDNASTFHPFKLVDYSGGVSVDASGLFYVGIYVVNMTGAAPTFQRQQLTVDLDLVTFDSLTGYAACEGTLCVSSHTTVATDFTPSSTTSFPCKQRGLSPDWCLFLSLATCGNGVVSAVVLPGDAHSAVRAGLYISYDHADTWSLVSTPSYFQSFSGDKNDYLWVACPANPSAPLTLYAGLTLSNRGYGLWALDATSPTNFSLVGLPTGTSTGYASSYPIVLTVENDATFVLAGGTTLSTAPLAAPSLWTLNFIPQYGQSFYSGIIAIATSGPQAVAWDATAARFLSTESVQSNSWTVVDAGFNVSTLAADPHVRGTYFASSRSNNDVFRSVNNGLKWEKFAAAPSPRL
jgi:hypothetical protein